MQRGALWLLAVALLYGATHLVDVVLDWLAPDPSDEVLYRYGVYILLPTLLAAPWIARGAWLVAAPVLGRLPRLRRGFASAAVAGWVIFAYDPEFIPFSLSVADEFTTDATDAPADDFECGSITAHPEYRVLYLHGGICANTPADFDAIAAAHPAITRITLDSTGGRVAAAIKLGERLAELGFDARVDADCSSACVTVLVGARRRWVGPDGWVGVHQVSADVWAEGGRRARWPMLPNDTTLAFHESRGVSPALETRAQQTAPTQLDFLRPEDIVAFGIAEIATDAPWLPPGTTDGATDNAEETEP